MEIKFLVPWYTDIVFGNKALKPVWDNNNLGLKVLRIFHFLSHRRPTLRIWHHGDPSPPSWSMLFSREQKCSGHTSTFFLGGGRGGNGEVSWVKYSKIRHTTCSFLNIFVQDWRFAQWWEHSLHTDVAWVLLRHSSFGFMFSPERIFPSANSIGNFKPRTRMSWMHYH